MSENLKLAGLSRVNVLGVGVHAIDMRQALAVFRRTLEDRRKGYVCVTGVHGIMEAQKYPEFKAILNGSLLTAPDGVPTVWVGRWQGYSQMQRVFGPELMLEVCAMSVGKGYTHFLYGGADGVAEQLKISLLRRFPGLRIVGTYTPPFRPLNQAEKQDLYARVSTVKPDIFWVGLSTPKQEHFMAEYLPHLDTRVMVGVGNLELFSHPVCTPVQKVGIALADGHGTDFEHQLRTEDALHLRIALPPAHPDRGHAVGSG